MKKSLLVISALAGLVTTTAVLAAEPVTTGLKIGVVEVKQVLQKIPQMTAVNQELEKQFKPRQQKLDEAQNALKADLEKMNRDGAVMNESDKAQLQDKIINERANVQALASTFQQDLNNAQSRAMQKLLTDVAKVVNKIAQDQKYDLILQGESVPYSNKRLNITDQVIADLSKR